MNGKTVIQLLKKAGWRHVSTHGSHHKLKKEGHYPVIVPVHAGKDLKIGTLRNIEKSTGVILRQRRKS